MEALKKFILDAKGDYSSKRLIALCTTLVLLIVILVVTWHSVVLSSEGGDVAGYVTSMVMFITPIIAFISWCFSVSTFESIQSEKSSP